MLVHPRPRVFSLMLVRPLSSVPTKWELMERALESERENRISEKQHREGMERAWASERENRILDKQSWERYHREVKVHEKY